MGYALSLMHLFRFNESQSHILRIANKKANCLIICTI